MDRQLQHGFLDCVLFIQHESAKLLPGYARGLWVLVTLLYHRLSLVEETS